MDALTHLNAVIVLLQQNAARIGITAASLFVSIHSIRIMLDDDNTPAARTERWARLKKVFLCTVIIAGTGAFVQFATGLGGML